MPPSIKQQEKLPMLLFMLEHRKWHQLIKSLLNEKFAKNLLEQYGVQKEQLTKIQLFKIKHDIQHFTIQDLIEIKGSNFQKVKGVQNFYLIQTILAKLKTNYKVQTVQRKLFWLQFTEIYNQQTLYQNLSQLQLPSDTQNILQKDIKRTYFNLPTSNIQEKQLATIRLRQSLRQSLSRFALYNPYLLYCQGMNQIFGFLYQQKFSPKQMFFIFKRITDVLLPTDYYSSLEGIVAYLKVFWQMITVLFPKIHHKLNFLVKQMDINGNYLCVFSYVLQWFVCLFTNSMINRQIKRTIMDYFLLQGITVLFKAALAIFQYLEDTILKVKSFQSYVIKVEEAVRKYDDLQNLRKFLNSKFISKQILQLMKEYSTNPKEQSLRKFMPYTKKCSRKWNFCLQQLQNNINSQHKYQFFVFKRKENVKIIPDYLNKIKSYYFDKKKNVKSIDLQRIGRIPHVCSAPSQTLTEDSLSQNNTKKQSPFVSRYSPSPDNPKLDLKESIKQNVSITINISNHPPLHQFTTDQSIHRNQPTYSNSKDLFSQSFIAVNDDQSIYHRKQTLQYRQLIKQKLLLETDKKTLQKSQSMMFMKMMVDNQSYSNLFSLLQNQEIDKMFDINSDSDQDKQSSTGSSPTYGKFKK